MRRKMRKTVVARTTNNISNDLETSLATLKHFFLDGLSSPFLRLGRFSSLILGLTEGER